MRLQVDIDAASGFCAGVIRAISTAEDYLRSCSRPSSGAPAPVLYSLGAIVHNDEELSRLSALGLKRIDTLAEALPADRFAASPDEADIPVLIRAHGENISLVSTEGVGSKFTFTLKRSDLNDELDDDDPMYNEIL